MWLSNRPVWWKLGGSLSAGLPCRIWTQVASNAGGAGVPRGPGKACSRRTLAQALAVAPVIQAGGEPVDGRDSSAPHPDPVTFTDQRGTRAAKADAAVVTSPGLGLHRHRPATARSCGSGTPRTRLPYRHGPHPSGSGQRES